MNLPQWPFYKRSSILKLQQANEALTLSCRELERQLEERSAELATADSALADSTGALLKKQEDAVQLLNSIPQMLWMATPDGVNDYYNERWYQFTGLDPEIIGEPSWTPLLHPDDVQKSLDFWYAAVRSGSRYENEARFWDRVAGIYRWHLCRAMPMRDQRGVIVRWIGTCTDIEGYKWAETKIIELNSDLEARVAERTQDLSRTNDELTRTQMRLQAVLDSSTQVSIIANDNNGIITLFNSGAEALLGHRAQDVVGKCTPLMFYPEEQRELRARLLSAQMGRPVPVDKMFIAANQPSGPLVSEWIYLHKDGTHIDISLATTTMIDSSGETIGRLAMAVDIRPLKALERQLHQNNLELQEQTRHAEEANRAKSDFLSAMSHEIRTPMNAILGMADLIWESELDATQRKYVEVFRRAGANLLTLVNDILDLSKIESGHFELEQINFDLRELVERTFEMIRPKTNTKGISLISRIAPDTPTVLMGDPTRLQQILINLLGNAVKFTEAGDIALAIRRDAHDSRCLHFEVTDTGIGIPADKIEAIFRDFTQSESSTTRRFGGTGLGLGICRRLVHRMGGQLNARSEFGKGSTFYFDAHFQQSSQEDLRHPEAVTGLMGFRVLIVDKDATNRLIFTETCRAWGMETSVCASSGAVLVAVRAAAANDEPFHLIIVDRLMGKMDGFELVAHIREIAPAVPIIMTASDREPGDQTRGQQLGIAGYAVQPVRRSELLRLVTKALGAHVSEEQERAMVLRPTEIVKKESGKLVEQRTGRILIVEDSDDNRFLLQAYLKTTAYQITFAENGEVAVQTALSKPFDLVLMDMQMPVMDGLEATRHIREAEAREGRNPVPVIALTANARREDIEASQAAGCNSHVSKPISKPKLLSIITEFIRVADAQPSREPTPASQAPGRDPAALQLSKYLQEAQALGHESAKNK